MAAKRVTKSFRLRLNREIRLYVRELRDGCLLCREVKGLCHDHHKLACDLLVNPRKYLDLTNKTEPRKPLP
jgi:hypothetical protein